MKGAIDFRRNVAALDTSTVVSLYRECTPKVLVVTDNLNFAAGNGFGLSQFVATLRAGTVQGMTPNVTTASRYASAGADITSYDFTNATNGLLKSRWDVLFLLGIDTEGNNPLSASPAQQDAITRFMQAGGGVFATGDHETLGAALCGDIPRVRGMRKWKAADAPPHVANTNRHSTNISGADETEAFSDQSDALPQRLFVNYRTVAGGSAGIDRLAHPVLQLAGRRRVIEVFPDHPHEGDCRVPASLTGGISIDGSHAPEWPTDAAGAAVSPEIAAYTVSAGDGFPTGPTGAKQGLVPKLFGAISAYDGHRARVGRVITDATWHHFVNINLDGSGSGQTAFLTAGGADTETMTRIRSYYVNLATWLMPATVRRCLRWPLVIDALQRFPLFEELDLPRPPELTGNAARALGRQLVQAISRTQPAYVAQALADDALEDAVGPERAARLRAQPDDSDTRVAALGAVDLGQAALGGQLVAMAEALEALKSPEQIRPHETFEAAAVAGARGAVQKLFGERRSELRRVDALLEEMEASVR